MPQLKFAWWLLKFLLGWTFIMIIFLMLSEKKLNISTSKHPKTNLNQSPTNKWLWN